ncbi:MAG: hypothetical protein ACT4P7_20150 [Gemmatimonadaceae bacterium]
MFGSETLDVLIGLALVFLLLSLIASALREALESMFRTRGVYLERGIRELLDSRDQSVWSKEWWTKKDAAAATPDLATALYQHPVISALYHKEYAPGTSTWARLRRWFGWHNLPTYIPANSFVTALLDIVVRGKETKATNGLLANGPRISPTELRELVPRLGNDRIGRVVLSAIDLADGDMAQVRANIEAWFDSAMDRVSGWYKRWTQLYLFAIGLLIAIWLNVNTITIARYLYRDQAARDAIVRIADGVSRDSAVLREQQVDTLIGRLDALGLPIGWRYGLAGLRAGDDSATMGFVGGPAGAEPSALLGALPLAIVGWLITALAVSLGAPFWFDLLNRFMVVRSTVKPHEKSPEEGSEDRQDRLPTGGRGGARRQTSSGGGAPQAPPTAGELLKRLPKQPTASIP